MSWCDKQVQRPHKPWEKGTGPGTHAQHPQKNLWPRKVQGVCERGQEGGKFIFLFFKAKWNIDLFDIMLYGRRWWWLVMMIISYLKHIMSLTKIIIFYCTFCLFWTGQTNDWHWFKLVLECCREKLQQCEWHQLHLYQGWNYKLHFTSHVLVSVKVYSWLWKQLFLWHIMDVWFVLS